MPPPREQSIVSRLEKIDRQNKLAAVLIGALLAVLGVTIALLQLSNGVLDLQLTSQNRYHFVVALSGLVVLFSLYILYKQRQQQSLREQLYQAMLREESLKSRLAGLSDFFDRVSRDSTQLELEPLVQGLAEHLRESLEADHASLMLLDPAANELRTHAVAGSDPEDATNASVPHAEGVAGSVIVTRQPLVLVADEIVQRFPTPHAPFRTAAAAMCVPLPIGDQAIGVLNVTRFTSTTPFTAEDARLVSVFAAHTAIVLKRIAERERAEEALREREEQLRQAQKMEALGRLAGGVAHDFNNLLTLILSYGRMLAVEVDPTSSAADRARKMVDAAERCAALTRQLLAFSRKQVLSLADLDLNRVVRETADLLGHLIEEHIEFVVDLAPDLGCVRADRSQIEQVIMNLVVNARDAMPQGGRLTIVTDETDLDETSATALGLAPGRCVRLRVRDTGTGMNAMTCEHVFEPFFTTKPGGTGLGLATVYGIVNQCGGSIQVESAPGLGATFTVHLPRTAAAPVEVVPMPIRRNGSAPDATILLVEDQADLRCLMRDVLKSAGHRVIEAGWAGEAALIAEEHIDSIDLLVTDVVMPGESGGQLAEWMTTRRPGLPVLYMSAYASDEIVHLGVHDHGSSFLQKPFTQEQLLAKVEEVLVLHACLASMPSAPAEDAELDEDVRKAA